MISTTAAEPRLVIERILAADRDTVFRCWTDPRQLAEWFGPTPEHTTPIAEIDLRVGGRYRIGMRKGDGDLHIVGGTYQEITPPERLAFTWAWQQSSMPSDETLVTVELHEHGKQTRLVLTHERFGNDQMRDQHSQGWSGCLNRLEQLVRRGA